MEEEANGFKNLKEEIERNITEPLKSRKKPKGCSRFLRNVIKTKAKVMKEIIQNRFYKWRKDALKGKIKKTVMIRISVSRPKEPKSKYQMSKPKPKEQSKSVNKDDFRPFNINKIPKNINNIKTQKVDKIEEDDNKNNKASQNKIINNKNNFVKVVDKKDKEKENNYGKININNKREIQPRKDTNYNKMIPNTKVNNYTQNKINKKDEISKITPRINKTKPVHNLNIPKPHQNRIRNNSQDLNKKPPTNNNVMSVVYTSSTKKNYPNENKYPKENNYYIRKNIQTEIKDKIPKTINKKYEGKHAYTPLTIQNVKIGLIDDKYSNRTFNRRNEPQRSSGNLKYNTNNHQNTYLYNNYTNPRRNNNINNRQANNYRIKPENMTNDSSSIYSKSRKDSHHTYDPSSFKNKLKGGITTVIQHYRGQRRRYENYDNITFDANKYEKDLIYV